MAMTDDERRERQRARCKAWRISPKGLAWTEANREIIRARSNAHYRKPGVAEHIAARGAIRRAQPGFKEWRSAYLKKRRAQPGFKEYKNEIQRNYVATPGGYLRRLRSGAKHRAKKLGLPFNLELHDIIIPERCPVFGTPLIRNLGRNGPNSPSIDRTIPELGYVKGNVSVISQRANTLKNNATLEELEALVNWMKKNS